MKKVCSLCGNTHYTTYNFKGGYVCEVCLQDIKSKDQSSESVLFNH